MCSFVSDSFVIPWTGSLPGRELRAFFSCMAWRAIPGPLSKRKRLLYSCLEISMDRGAWWATVHRVTRSQMQLSNFHFRHSKGLQMAQAEALLCLLPSLASTETKGVSGHFHFQHKAAGSKYYKSHNNPTAFKTTHTCSSPECIRVASVLRHTLGRSVRVEPRKVHVHGLNAYCREWEKQRGC